MEDIYEFYDAAYNKASAAQSEQKTEKKLPTLPPNAKPYIIPFKRTNPKYRLFCLPPSGGKSSFFRTICKDMPQDCEVIALEYPGRGLR
jgi:hypothetical protein